MNKRIIYSNGSGGISVLIPAENSGLTIEQIAQKDVPAGVPYNIVDVTDIPEDRTFRNAWEAQIDEPDGYGIGPEAWFAEQENNQ
jgi:hypothetical protein